jgi:hypothetical protein
MANDGITQERACVQCGNVFQLQLRYFNKMYCGPACKTNAFREANPDRFLALRAVHREREKARAAADRAERAKQPMPTKPCPTCSGMISTRRVRCDECNRKLASLKTGLHQRRKLLAEIDRRPDRQCKECAASFNPVHGAMVFCGKQCSERNIRRALKGKREAAKRGVGSERVDPIKVFDRDGWRCHMCKRRTPRDLRGTYKPNAPELDHIVPLSLGGGHTYKNTACSCRECNGRKGATTLGQPSLLALCV